MSDTSKPPTTERPTTDENAWSDSGGGPGLTVWIMVGLFILLFAAGFSTMGDSNTNRFRPSDDAATSTPAPTSAPTPSGVPASQESTNND